MRKALPAVALAAFFLSFALYTLGQPYQEVANGGTTLAINLISATHNYNWKISDSSYSYAMGIFISSGPGFNSSPVSFTSVINQSSLPVIIASKATGTIIACANTASASPNIQQFIVSGSDLTSTVTATASSGFEVSLGSGNGYSSSLTLNPINGSLNSTTIYVRASASAVVGNISGNITLSSAGAENQNVEVTGTVNPLPIVDAITNQTVTNGASTTAINFSGTGGNTVFNWVNNMPGIGLPASGLGNISPFIAVNKGASPVTATVTVTPVSEGYAYIENGNDGTISIINVSTNKVVSTLRLPTDCFCVCISPDGSKAYIGCSGGTSTIAVINTATNTITNVIPVSSSGESTGIVVSPDGSNLYVANYVDNTVTAVNAITGAIVARIPVGQYPLGVAISPDGSKVYVAYTYSNYVSVINTASNSISGTINVGGPDVAVSSSGEIYIPVANTNHVAVIDPATNTVKATIITSSAPGVIAISPDGTRAYVVTGTNNIDIINTATNAVITTIPVGVTPNGICVSPDGDFVYVANTGSNNVSVINTSTNRVVATVNVGNGPISFGNFVTPGSGCNGAPTSFNITVNPSVIQPQLTVGAVSGSITACAGTASASPDIQQFSVSANNLTTNVSAIAPAGFEVSLTADGSYGSKVTLSPINGVLNSSTVYVRSAAGDAAGNIQGNVSLRSAGATTLQVAVSGTISALPIVNPVNSQLVTNGSATTSINFTGTADTYSWTNNTPTIGLTASGTGNIPSFIAEGNNSNIPVTATITVTPVNNSGCSGAPKSFSITVNPMPASVLSAQSTLTGLTTVYGTASQGESFYISGTNLTAGILVTAPLGFEVSDDGINYGVTTLMKATGLATNIKIFIRLTSTTPVGGYTGNIVLSAPNAGSINVTMPLSKVTPAPLTVIVNDKIKAYGTPNPSFTVNYSGFVNNENVSQLTKLPQITTTATVSSPPGQYPIIAANAGSANYTFAYIPGVLTIEPSSVITSSLIIPNTFTPNGDGKNDTWNIKDLSNYPRSTVDVFSRWGQKVFSSIGYPIPWDGTYKGTALPSGTYYYIIDQKNGQAIFSGWLVIIR